MTISVVIHTYNSEKYLDECLSSVEQADEIIVCDMYSTDKTVEIAEKHGAIVIYHENVGFADPARNFAMSHVTSDWLLVVDSDEVIPQALWDYLRNHIKGENPEEGLEIPRKNIVLGKIMWSWYPNCIQRFWKKGCVSWPANVHETPDTYGRLKRINPKLKDAAIIHYNYDSIEAFISRTNKYTSLELKKFQERNIKFSLSLLLVRPFLEFLKRYFLKMGFREGMHGFIFSTFLAFYKFLAAAKLWELELKQKNI